MTLPLPTAPQSSRKPVTTPRRLWALYLVVLGGRPLPIPRRYEVKRKETTLGRWECDIPIGDREDDSVSNRHATFVLDLKDKLVVRDQKSTWGSFVNGVRLRRGGSSKVRDKDVLTVGDTHVIARLETAESRPKVDGEMVAVSRVLLSALDLLERIARSNATVLITGPTGSGKEEAARFFHRASGRHGAFVAINCAALPADLLEKELFGHKKGAFTGAVVESRGAVGAAEGGTLFLDEIGELPLVLQAKLLRFLEDQSERQVGAEAARRFDVRVVLATNRDLSEEIRERRFRDDLAKRIVHHVALPPLDERPEETFAFLCRFWNGRSRRLSPDLVVALARCQFPGNVRDVRRVAAALALTHEPHVPQDLPRELQELLRLKLMGDLARARQGQLEIDPEAAVQLLEGGLSQRRVAQQLGQPRRSLMRAVEAFLQKGRATSETAA